MNQAASVTFVTNYSPVPIYSRELLLNSLVPRVPRVSRMCHSTYVHLAPPKIAGAWSTAVLLGHYYYYFLGNIYMIID